MINQVKSTSSSSNSSSSSLQIPTYLKRPEIIISIVGSIVIPLFGIIVAKPEMIGCPLHIMPSEQCQIPAQSITVGGSTSMVNVTEAIVSNFKTIHPNTNIKALPSSSDDGVEKIQQGGLHVAAVSRELTPDEKKQGLLPEFVAVDKIAVVVGKDNPITELTSSQLRKIFQGEITNWSEVGGNFQPIRVINRPKYSGTYNAFQKQVLEGNQFGYKIKSWPIDGTTSILQALKKDGISYATYAQVENQKTVRVLRINELSPKATNYPYQRNFYYVYLSKNAKKPAVKIFLDYVRSPEGRKTIESAMKSESVVKRQ